MGISIIPKTIKALKKIAGKAEYEIILRVLKEVEFNKTKAAERLSINRKTLYNKLTFFKNIGIRKD